MKKKILSGIFSLTLLVTAGYGVSKTMGNDAGLSASAFPNINRHLK